MTHIVGYDQDGTPVHVDLVKTEAAKYIAREPRLLTLAAEVLEQITLEEPVIDIEYDMGRAIGYDFVVKTADTDTVFYAQIVRDTLYTRFIKNGKPPATNYISIRLKRSQDGSSYDMQSIWIGHLLPPVPGHAEATVTSKSYWESHAFVFENQPIQPRTITKTCPY